MEFVRSGENGEQRSLRALPYDRSRRRVETDLTFMWEVVEGNVAWIVVTIKR